MKRKEEKKIENIFLAYANYSLREDPRYFEKILNVIEEYTYIVLDHRDKLNEWFCEIAKCKNERDLLPFLKPAVQAAVKDEEGFLLKCVKYLATSTPKEATEIDLGLTSMEVLHLEKRYRLKEVGGVSAPSEDPMEIINAFFGKRIIKYDQHSIKFEWNCKCKLRPDMTAFIGKDLCKVPFKLKCCECHQYDFIRTLRYIAAGVIYHEVDGFGEHVAMADKISPKTIYFAEGETPYNLIKATVWESFDMMLGNFELSGFLNAIASYSLLEFLTQDERNRERLKICHRCGLLYVKSRHRNDQRFCSEECRKYSNNHKPGAKEKLNELKRKKRKQGAKQSYY